MNSMSGRNLHCHIVSQEYHVAGQYGSHGAPGRDKLSESKLRDHLHGSEYVLTYEDRDGDWMLVGEIPWE